MTETKEEATVTLLNRGQRSYETMGPDGKSRRHAQGTTMTYSASEAEKLSGYKDLIDITKLPGQVDTAKLKSDNDALSSENEKLKAQLAALGPKPAEEKVEGKRKSKSVE